VSDLAQPISSAMRAAASAGFDGLNPRIGQYFSSGQPAKVRAEICFDRDPLAAIGPRLSGSPEKSRGEHSKSVARIGPAIRSVASHCLAPAAVVCLMFAPAHLFGAQGEGLIVSDAWVPAADEVGRDIPLLAAIKNETGAPDALMRVRCPVANFSEKHTVDRGEGSPAMRAISSIPVPAGSTVMLKPSEYHVMLLQIRQPLAVGGHFNCTLVFQKAGAIETEVEVRRTP